MQLARDKHILLKKNLYIIVYGGRFVLCIYFDGQEVVVFSSLYLIYSIISTYKQGTL